MRPFPYDRLRRMTKAQAVELARWARAAPIAALVRRGREARGWLGAPLELRLGAAVSWADAEVPASEGAYALLEGVRPAGLVLAPRVACAIVERALGAGAEAVGARGPLGEVERGVLAYALARWLGEGAYSVGAVFAHAPALVEAVGPRLVWPLELAIGDVTGRGALWLPEPAGVGVAPPRAAAAWLPLRCVVDAGEATLPAAEIAALRAGDVLVPDRLTIDREGLGTVRLRPLGSGLTWVLRSDGALTLERIEHDALPPTRGRRQRTEERMSEETIAKLGETPITLHVEVARVELTLGDVAGLSVGEVLRTGRTLSERVTLRAGDRAVAYGELVDVEGELGVQITEVVGEP
ncbi:MAG: type III secretion system cytoplasmic ring protein SctQ [Sandaracinaceae bacterium]|nr:type III secretion system cytoplasmic ring protein SctQ [Sandaracinaceae bacterium]